MIDTHLGEIKNIEFDNKIILSPSGQWIKYFDTTEHVFSSLVKDGKYVPVCPKILVGSTKQNTTETTGYVSKDNEDQNKNKHEEEF